jgi:hypothetical protein
MLKNDLLLAFRKNKVCLDIKSKCQYDKELIRQKKNSRIEDGSSFIFQTAFHIQQKTTRHKKILPAGLFYFDWLDIS